MGKKLLELYKENYFYEQRYQIPSQNFKTIFDCMPQLFFRPQYVWFLVLLYVALIPNFSGQLAELIIYIIPLE